MYCAQSALCFYTKNVTEIGGEKMDKKKRHISIFITMGVSEETRFLLREKLDKEGIYAILDRLYERKIQSSSEPAIIRLALINLFENKPTHSQIQSWEKMLSSIKEFDNFLKS